MMLTTETGAVASARTRSVRLSAVPIVGSVPTVPSSSRTGEMTSQTGRPVSAAAVTAFRPPALLRRMVRAGKLGKKSGRGFYEWRAEQK